MDTTSSKRTEMILWSALGAEVKDIMLDPLVTEIRINSDGKLWKCVFGLGAIFTGSELAAKDVLRAIQSVAFSVGSTCNEAKPHLAAELPGGLARFQGVLPPISPGPVIIIRKQALKIYSLPDLIAQGVLTNEAAKILTDAIDQKQNILVAGSTDSGKTTFANGLLDYMAQINERIVILEDTRELQCNALDKEYYRTKEGISLRELVQISMRSSPGRLVVGEVRGAEALEMLKGWNSGHPGIATVHASSAKKSLSRLEQLVEEANVSTSRSIVSEAVDLIVFMEKENNKRKVKELMKVNGWDGTNYITESLQV